MNAAKAEPSAEDTPVHHGPVALFGGIYNNHVALASAIQDARRRGCVAMYCLGDLGAFGPHPDKVFPLLIDNDVRTLRGNYDDSVARGLDDCQCGYTDPADNHYARISYRYTYARTSAVHRPWLAAMPDHLRFTLARPGGGALRAYLCHGSPRRTNEFLWESTTPTHLLAQMLRACDADVLAATHTGLPWRRNTDAGLFVNVGVLGRPANDGTPEVGYTILDATTPDIARYVRLAYDHEALADEMRREDLPQPFIDTILTGWWTTCLEILPAKERARGRY